MKQDNVKVEDDWSRMKCVGDDNSTLKVLIRQKLSPVTKN